MPTHKKFHSFVREINHVYQREPALYEVDFQPEGFQWINANDAENSIFSYIRYAKDRSDFLVIVCNFTPVPRHEYRVGVPAYTHYEEILNSDSDAYGGSNVGNYGGFHSDSFGANGFDYSLNLTLPPLGIIIMKPRHS
jgi:1,4-alpha-glucan branching enzyme